MEEGQVEIGGATGPAQHRVDRPCIVNRDRDDATGTLRATVAAGPIVRSDVAGEHVRHRGHRRQELKIRRGVFGNRNALLRADEAVGGRRDQEDARREVGNRVEAVQIGHRRSAGVGAVADRDHRTVDAGARRRRCFRHASSQRDGRGRTRGNERE